MKHLIRDSIVWLVSIVGITAIYRSKLRAQGPLVRVLCFHDVADGHWFEKVIQKFTTRYHVLTPAEFYAKKFHTEKINLLLTFDDGYQSWVDVCAPVLKKYNCKGLFFVCSGLLDGAGDIARTEQFMRAQLRITPKAALSWEGTRVLLAAGHTIGGHTVTHRNLMDASSEEMQREIIEDKKKTESMLGVTLQHFAYPFGTEMHYTARTRSVVYDAGYQHTYSAMTGFYTSELLDIPRTLLEKNQSRTSIVRWIEGGYDMFRMIQGKGSIHAAHVPTQNKGVV
ncbi:MAG: polysaccharide deacetylase family protein [Candidatus Pacebacteria bacterium]|nr:polysaccharide deacetylase family protein [Candidatus Paceibacterota bacterium]